MPDWLSIVKSQLNTPRPSQGFAELWPASIRSELWGTTNPATGAAWALGGTTRRYAGSSPNALELARLRRSPYNLSITPTLYDASFIFRRAILDFELQLANVANILNTTTFFGFGDGAIATRATNNIIGFALVGDALMSITDRAGVETTNTGFGETLTNFNRFTIKVFAGHCEFWLNGTRIADHTTNLPDFAAMILHWYLETEAGGAATINVGPIRCWQEDLSE